MKDIGHMIMLIGRMKVQCDKADASSGVRRLVATFRFWRLARQFEKAFGTAAPIAPAKVVR